MTPEAAVQEFLGSFGLPAYPSSSVPEQTAPEWGGFPYITYDLALGEWMQGDVNMPVNVWYRTDSEAEPNEKVREIAEAIGIGGVLVKCDGGMMWLKKGSPWAQAVVVDGEDEAIKRRYININIEFMLIW